MKLWTAANGFKLSVPVENFFGEYTTTRQKIWKTQNCLLCSLRKKDSEREGFTVSLSMLSKPVVSVTSTVTVTTLALYQPLRVSAYQWPQAGYAAFRKPELEQQELSYEIGRLLCGLSPAIWFDAHLSIPCRSVAKSTGCSTGSDSKAGSCTACLENWMQDSKLLMHDAFVDSKRAPGWGPLSKLSVCPLKPRLVVLAYEWYT